MNILIAIPCLNRGGTEMQTFNLVKVLVEAGHSVTTLCYFEYDPEVVDEYRQAGCRVKLMDLQRDLPAWKIVSLLRVQFKAFKPDVVHVQYMAPGALPILAARLAGIKKILATVHQPSTPSHGRLSELLLRFSARICTRFIAVSVNAEKSWFGNGQLPDETRSIKSQPRHFTIYNAVDGAQLQDIQQRTDLLQEKNVLGIAPGKLVIGVVSRLRHEKGIDLLINALPLVLKQFPDIHLLIVGTGPDETKLKEKVLNLNIGHNVTFFGEAGWETAMGQMALMDIVVVPSRFEGFGLTAAEAMAMGKPVIASDVYGLSEVVTDGETGVLFPVEDTEALANCIITLCNNPDLRVKFGANGQHKAEKQFDIAVFKEKTTWLYRHLI